MLPIAVVGETVNKYLVMRKIVVLGILMLMGASVATAQTEKVKYGDFQQWITRTIHESAVIGGATRTLYEVGPTATIDGNKAYTNRGGSPWARSGRGGRVRRSVQA